MLGICAAATCTKLDVPMAIISSCQYIAISLFPGTRFVLPYSPSLTRGLVDKLSFCGKEICVLFLHRYSHAGG